jgi:hypothetical protein
LHECLVFKSGIRHTSNAGGEAAVSGDLKEMVGKSWATVNAYKSNFAAFHFSRRIFAISLTTTGIQSLIERITNKVMELSLKILGVNLRGGAVCGALVLLALVLVVAVSFPGFISGASKALAVVSACTIAAGLFFYAAYKISEYERFLKIVRAIEDNFFPCLLLGLVTVLIVGGGVVTEYEVIQSSFAAALRKPVDPIGTLIPVSAVTVISLHIIMLIGAVCLGRHVLYPLSSEINNRWQRILLSTVIAASAMFWINGFMSVIILKAYQDDNAYNRTILVERIDSAKQRLGGMERDLQELDLKISNR